MPPPAPAKKRKIGLPVSCDKVDDFLKYNKEGKDVEVDFNVRTNEYQGKYYTSLQAWKVFKSDPVTAKEQAPDREKEDLPF